MSEVAYLRAVRQAIRTTTGTQDFTVAGFGTPKGAIVLLSRASTSGAITDNLSFSVGFTDGTRSRCVAESSLDNVADSDTARMQQTAILKLIDSTSVLVSADFSAWVTDGVRLNFTVVDGTAWLATVILIGGTDAQVYVSDFDMPDNTGTPNQTLDVTAPGFAPTWGLFSTAGIAVPGASPSASALFSLGLFSNGGSLEQCTLSWSHGDAKATSTPSMRLDPTTAVLDLRDSAAAAGVSILASITLDSILANGFRVKDNLGSDPPPIAYIAVSMGGLVPDLFTLDSPTSGGGTATATFTNPDSALVFGSLVDATGANKADTQGGSFCIGFTSQSEEFSIGVHEQDAQATMNNGTTTDSKALTVLTDAGAAGLVAAASYNTSSLKFTFSTVQGTARKQFVLVFPSPIFTGTGAPLFPKATGAATAQEQFIATGAASFPRPTSVATAEQQFVGASAASFPRPIAIATAEEQFVAVGAALFPKPTATGVGEEQITGTSSAFFPIPTGSGTAQLQFIAVGSGSFRIPTGTAAAEEQFVGVSTASFPRPTGAAEALEEFIAEVAAAFALPTGTGAGEVSTVATGAASFPIPTGTGVAQEQFVATSAGFFPLPFAIGNDALGIGCEHEMPAGYRALQLLQAGYQELAVLSAGHRAEADLLASHRLVEELRGEYDGLVDLGGANC